MNELDNTPKKLLITHKPKISIKSAINKPDTNQITKQKRSDIVQQPLNTKRKESKFIIQPTKKDIENRKIEKK
jgi:hypothetical protein